MDMHCANHPDDRNSGGAAVINKPSLDYHLSTTITEPHLQAIAVAAQFGHAVSKLRKVLRLTKSECL